MSKAKQELKDAFDSTPSTQVQAVVRYTNGITPFHLDFVTDMFRELKKEVDK